MGDMAKSRKNLTTLPVNVILKIRALKIQQKRCKRGKRGGYKHRQNNMKLEYKQLRQQGINRNNLIAIKAITDRHVKNRSKNLTVGLANVRSIKNKDNLLKQMLVEKRIDICVLTETWLNNKDNQWIESTELNKDGFRMENSFRKNGRKGGGIGLVYKDGYRIKKQEEKHTKTYHSVKWKLTMKNTHLHIMGVYRPPSNTTTVNQFTDEFLEHLQEDIINSKNLIILGDFNIHIDDDTDCDAEAFKDSTDAIGLIQHVNTYTHRLGHTLDHVYTLVGCQPIVSRCRTDAFISDHCMIITDTSIERGDIERCTTTSRNFRNFDLDDFKSDLKFQWSETCTLEELVHEYRTVAEKCMEKHAPLVTKTVTKRKQELWYNERILEQKRRVRRRERVWRKYVQDHQWKAYTVERNRLNRMIFANKTETLCLKVEECEKDNKKLYSLLNSMCGTHKHNPMPVAESEQVQADTFADYFLQKIVCECIRDTLKDYAQYCPSGECEGQLPQFEPVTEEDVRKTILTLGTKSCELDEIPTKHLKQCLNECLGIITRIMNLSLQNGLFVSSWKTAVVRPLLKKAGLQLIHSNYRPVSNLNFLSKVLEKLVLYQFNDHCAKFHLYPDYQSAYRKYFSCETALLKIVDDILWNMEVQTVTALACIDLSAAFDTVDHHVLLDVLRVRFGITDVALDWFASYLRPREFMVNVGDAYSSKKELTFSVPQGSCAGPTLYSVYASTMADVIPSNLDIHGYADDHAIKVSFTSGIQSAEEKAILDMEGTLAEIRSWMNTNRLKMNDSKTEYIVFGSRQQLNKLCSTTLNVNDTPIEASDCVKYLGVYLDKNLNLKQQITAKCKVACLNLFRIKNIRRYLTQEACKVLVLGLVIVHLDYANGLYVGLPKKDIERLQRIQNLAAKVIMGRDKSDSATQCLKDLHWLPIHLRIQYKILVTVFKCMHNQAPGYLINMLHKPEKIKNTREASDHTLLDIPTTKRRTFADRGFSVAGPTLWKKLPAYLRNIQTLCDFKKQLKTCLFAKF